MSCGDDDGPIGPSAASFPEVPVPPQRVSDLNQAAGAAGCTVRSFRSEGQQHVTEPVRYESSPPHSGNHSQVPAEDGAYDEAAANENLVHSLEHGRVIVQFRPSVSKRVKGQGALRRRLVGFRRGRPRSGRLEGGDFDG